jgi:hypothetical protein
MLPDSTVRVRYNPVLGPRPRISKVTTDPTTQNDRRARVILRVARQTHRLFSRRWAGW